MYSSVKKHVTGHPQAQALSLTGSINISCNLDPDYIQTIAVYKMASTKNRPRNKSATTTGWAARDKFFKIFVKLIPTQESFEIKKVANEMKVSELKKEVEFASGIPYHMQRLRYLDEGEAYFGTILII